MKEKTKVYIYTRVSTAVQVDGYSLDAQKSRMKAYAEFNDFEIVGVADWNLTAVWRLSSPVKMACPMCWCSSYHVLAEMRQMCCLPYR